MSLSQSPSANYADSLRNYLSTYLCPRASEKPYPQKDFQADRFQAGIHFEELRVLKRAQPVTTSVTDTHNENKPPEQRGTDQRSQCGVPVYETRALNPDVPPYQSGRQTSTPMANHALSSNVNVNWRNIGKPVSQSGAYSWKTGLASPTYMSQTENMMLPGDGGQFHLQTDDGGVLKVFTKFNGQDVRHNDVVTTDTDSQSVSACRYQRQYNASCDVVEPLNYGGEITKQRKLPNISTFRRFANSYKFDSISQDEQSGYSEVTEEQNQTRSRNNQGGDRWSMLDKEQFNSEVTIAQKPKIAPRQGIFQKDDNATTEGNQKGSDRYCNSNNIPNQVSGDNSHENFYDHGKRKYRCNVCFKAFSQTANLKAHTRIHTGERPFGCPVCNRRFSQRSSVKTHMRIHSGERPFPCRFCKKSFYDSSTLIKHRRIHTGEKPYLCKICHQRFSQSGNLTRHYKLHVTTKF